MLTRLLPVAAVEQLAISGSNLMTVLLVARSETRAGFGAFALAYSTLLLANSALMAIVLKPLIALEDRRDADSTRRRTGMYLSMQLVLSMTMSVTVAIAGTLAGAGPTFLALGAAILPVHALELMRRALLQRLAVRQALGYNLLFGVASITGLTVLAWLGLLTGPRAFLVMGASALVAALAAAGRLGIRPVLSRGVVWAEARRAWAFTRWSASVTLVESLEARGYAYLAAGVLGLSAPAVLEIGRVVLAPTNVFVFPVGNLGLPAVSYLSMTGELDRVRRVVRQAVLVVATGVGLYALATWWLAEPLLGLLYGSLYDDAIPVVRALAAAHVVLCLSGIVGLCLEATGRPRPVFFAQMWGGIVGLAVAWLLLNTIGIIGVAGGMAAGASAALWLKARSLRRVLTIDDAPSSSGVTTLKV